MRSTRVGLKNHELLLSAFVIGRIYSYFRSIKFVFMKKSVAFIFGMLMLSVIAFSCKSKKSGCEAYSENSGAKKSTEQGR